MQYKVRSILICPQVSIKFRSLLLDFYLGQLRIISQRGMSLLCTPHIYDIVLLSYDVASGSEITPCNKIDKPLVVYRFTGNVMTSITTLRT